MKQAAGESFWATEEHGLLKSREGDRKGGREKETERRMEGGREGGRETVGRYKEAQHQEASAYFKCNIKM